MANTKLQKRVNELSGKLAQQLIEFCYKEKIHNPKITMDAKVSNGEHYRLVFERLDIDEMILKDE